MNKPKLKPCPFCGEKQDGKKGIELFETCYLEYTASVICKKCNASVWTENKSASIRRWNRRVM